MATAIRVLIREMWRAIPTWGSPRRVGALRTLALQVAPSPVAHDRVRPQTPPSPTWKTSLTTHRQALVALDGWTVAMGPFRVRCVLVSLAHERRRVVQIHVTEPPTAVRTARAVLEAFPWDEGPRSR